MSTNVSGFGLSATIVASATFPNGFKVTQFADDADPIDTPELVVADSAMGPNGDLITWSHPTPLEMTISVIPRTPDDVNLQVLLEANRIGKGKQSAKDVLTVTLQYPDGMSISLTPGQIVSGPPLAALAGNGRLKTHTYRLRFENRTVANQ